MGQTGKTWVVSYTVFAACSAAGGPSPDLLDASVVDSQEPATAGDASPSDTQVDAGAKQPVTAPPAPVQLVELFPAAEDTSECGNPELAYDFVPTSSEFSVKSAFWAMWFAQRAMLHGDPGVRAELDQLGFTRVQLIEANDVGMQAFVAARPDVLILAFRGSTELVDWLGDFNFPQQDGALHGVPGKVHQGFVSALEAVWPALETLVPAFRDRRQPLWVTGHSLGGGEAALAAVRLASLGVPIEAVYTFGAPRAGNEAFARAASELLDGQFYRIVNETDIVPHLPPTAQAADAASPIVPIAGGVAAGWLRELDYLHAGSMYWFAEATGSTLTTYPLLDDSQDVPYWQVASQGGTLGVIARSGEQGKRHAHQRYLCRLYQARLAGTP